MGFQPDTGDQLLPITKDVVDQWKTQFAQRTRHVPKLVDPEKYVFFDPLSGEALSWYWRNSNGSYEFYDSPASNLKQGTNCQSRHGKWSMTGKKDLQNEKTPLSLLTLTNIHSSIRLRERRRFGIGAATTEHMNFTAHPASIRKLEIDCWL